MVSGVHDLLPMQAPMAIPKLTGKKINRTNVTIGEVVSIDSTDVRKRSLPASCTSSCADCAVQVQSEILAPGTDVLTLK